MRPRLVRRRLAALALFAGLLGAPLLSACETEPDELHWTVQLEPGTARRVSRIDVRIVRDACGSDDLVYEASVVRSEGAPRPPVLAPGRYALEGIAVSDDCTVIAAGCLLVQTPPAQQGVVVLVLEDVPEIPICSGACRAVCEAGEDALDAGNSRTPPLIGNGGSPRDSGTTRDADMEEGGAGGGTDGGRGEDAATLPGGSHSDGGEAFPEAGAAVERDAGSEGAVDPTCDGIRRPGGNCYRLVESPQRTWPDAEADCVTWGGHLVSLNSAEEELWLAEQRTALPSPRSTHWLGFNDRAEERTWVWSDGSQKPGASVVLVNLQAPLSERFRVQSDAPYTHWGPRSATTGNSEPNNGDGNSPFGSPGEDCASSRRDLQSGPGGIVPRPTWDDRSCDTALAYVCEHP